MLSTVRYMTLLQSQPIMLWPTLVLYPFASRAREVEDCPMGDLPIWEFFNLATHGVLYTIGDFAMRLVGHPRHPQPMLAEFHNCAVAILSGSWSVVHLRAGRAWAAALFILGAAQLLALLLDRLQWRRWMCAAFVVLWVSFSALLISGGKHPLVCMLLPCFAVTSWFRFLQMHNSHGNST